MIRMREKTILIILIALLQMCASEIRYSTSPCKNGTIGIDQVRQVHPFTRTIKFMQNNKMCYRVFDVDLITCEFLGFKVLMNAHCVCRSPTGNWFFGNSPFSDEDKALADGKPLRRRSSDYLLSSSPHFCKRSILNSTEGVHVNTWFYLENSLCSRKASDNTVNCPPSRELIDAKFVCVTAARQSPTRAVRSVKSPSTFPYADVIVRDPKSLAGRGRLVLRLSANCKADGECFPAINYSFTP